MGKNRRKRERRTDGPSRRPGVQAPTQASVEDGPEQGPRDWRTRLRYAICRVNDCGKEFDLFEETAPSKITAHLTDRHDLDLVALSKERS